MSYFNKDELKIILKYIGENFVIEDRYTIIEGKGNLLVHEKTKLFSVIDRLNDKKVISNLLSKQQCQGYIDKQLKKQILKKKEKREEDREEDRHEKKVIDPKCFVRI